MTFPGGDILKKLGIVLALGLILSGCGAQETLETVSDLYVQPVSAVLQQVVVDIPQEASATVMQSDTAGTMYLCDDYTITLQTFASGDLDKTLQTATGYGKDKLQIMQTRTENAKRYECVWTAAGEGQTQVGRTCVLDDGSYHYVLTVMAAENRAGELMQAWKALMESFRIASPDVDFNTGS